MADRYLVATGNWNDNNTWAATSGGAAGASFPVAGDNVFLNAASGAVTLTINVASACANFDCTGFTGTVAGAFGLTVSGSFTLSAGMTWSYDAFGFDGITFTSTAAGKTITTAGKSLNDVILIFNGTGGVWTLIDALTTGTNGSIQVNAGTLDTDSQTVTTALITVQSSGILTLDASTINLINGFTISGASSTLNSGTSTINISSSSGALAGNGNTFNTVNFTSTSSGTRTISGTNTFTNLSFTNGAVNSNDITLSGDQTVTGTFTCNGNSASNRPLFRSNAVGTVRTVTAAAVALQDVDFQDITGAGAAAPFTGTRIGDCKGNSGITFTTAANKFWINDANASWNTANSWALSSGGAGATNNYPLPQDTCIFDANSYSANRQIVTVSNSRIGSIDFTALDQTLNISNLGDITIFGDLTFDANVTISDLALWAFSGRNTQTITSAGLTWTQSITIDSLTGTVILADPMTISGTRTLTLTRGTLNMNGQALSIPRFSSSNSNTRAITSGGATMTLTGNNATIWTTASSAGFTLNDALQVDCTYSGSTGSRTLSTGALSEANVPSFKFSAGTDTVNLGTGPLKNVDFTGSSVIWSAQTHTIYGNLTLSTGMTVSGGSSTLSFRATSGTKTITSNGKDIARNITFNGVGGTWQLQDAMTVSGGRVLTLQAGTLDINGQTLTIGSYVGNIIGANRELKSTAAGGKIVTTETVTGTVWNQNAFGMTITRNSWTIEIGGNTTNTRTFIGGGATYPALVFTNTTANGQLNITGSNTFHSITVSNPPQSILFTAGTTTTIENGFPSGTVGNLVTIGSITAASHALAASGSTNIACEYLSISRSDASPAATWYAGTTSTDGGNNTGWLFEGVPPFEGNNVGYFHPRFL